MSLINNFTITSGTTCKTTPFTETTGAYSLTANPTGYGTPNPAIGTATAATLDIVLQDGTVIDTIDLFAFGFPTATDSPVYDILNTTLGYGSDANIPSQIITATYTVAGNDGADWVVSTTKSIFLRCVADCCVQTFAANVDACGDCGCKDEKMNKFLLASGYLDSIELALLCGSTDRAINILACLNDLCNSSGCGCQ